MVPLLTFALSLLLVLDVSYSWRPIRTMCNSHLLRMKISSDLPTSTQQKYADNLRLLQRSAMVIIPLVISQVKSAKAFGPGNKPEYFSSLRQDITNLIKTDMNKGPTLVRLAWHSSGTYDKMTKSGGSEKGTIRFKEELAHGANAGLDLAVGWLEPFKSKYPDLSYADLYTLSGIVAIETLGGPSIPWRAGRKDAIDASDVTPDGRLPSADKGSPANT